MYLEGFLAVVFIAIGIISSVMKQQQNQGRGRGGTYRQQGQYRQRPLQEQMHIPEQLKRTVMDMGKSWGEELKGAEKYMPSPVTFEEREGIELEDRSRTGSLDYVEQSQSSEGVCNIHPEHEQKKKAVPKTEAKVREENPIFEITEDNLISSIIMAEIIGPPRSMKRNIR